MADIDFVFTDDSEDDDLQIFDDIDLADDTELRRVIYEVETFLQQKKSLRISVLDVVQWEKALTRYLPRAARRRTERNVHILRDTADSHHLLISPSAVQGINERSQVIYAELIYHVLRCIPTSLSEQLQRGVDGLFAELIGKRLQTPLGSRLFPEQINLVQGLVLIVHQEFGYKPLDWARLLRKDPDRFFLALRKSKFITAVLAAAKEDPIVSDEIEKAPNKRQTLIDLLRASDFRVSSPYGRLLQEQIRNYLSQSTKKDTVSR